jgi:hypothetical protein
MLTISDLPFLLALTFGRSAFVPLKGINVHVARGGYSGEDGFEVSPLPVVLNPCYLLTPNRISIPPAHTTFLASPLLACLSNLLVSVHVTPYG